MNKHQLQAKNVLWIYAIGVWVFVAILYTPLRIPCIWHTITGIPCPGCGLTRAFISASRLDFVGAMQENILFLPILVIMIAYFVGALIEIFLNKRAINWINSILNQKWMIAIGIILLLISWYLNIMRGA
jgi:uncharacterized membrane protein